MKIFCIALFVMLMCSSCQTKKSDHSEQTDTKQDNTSQEVTTDKDTATQETLKEESTKDVSKKSKTDSEQKEESKEKWLTEERLWEMYNQAKAKVKKAEKKKDFEEMSKYSYEAAIYANALERNDIEAWQYNNASYYLIEDFKTKTDYQTEMDHLNKLEMKEDILEYRESMKKIFRKQNRLLSKADGYLKKAKEVDDKLEKSDRTRIIANNILFVDDVMKFMDMGDEE